MCDNICENDNEYFDWGNHECALCNVVFYRPLCVLSSFYTFTEELQCFCSCTAPEKGLGTS